MKRVQEPEIYLIPLQLHIILDDQVQAHQNSQEF